MADCDRAGLYCELKVVFNDVVEHALVEQDQGMRVLPQVRPDRVLEAIGHSVVKLRGRNQYPFASLSNLCTRFTQSWSEPVRA